MNYSVLLQPRANRDALRQAQYIALTSARAANEWLKDFDAALDTLAIFPERCALAHESKKLNKPVRELLFGKREGKRRILFVIEGDTVRVIAVRHSAQSDATAEDLLD